MSQALNMHYLRPWSDVAPLSQACVLRVFQRCWKTSRDFTDMPQSDTDNIHLAAMATALTSMYSWPFPTEIIASHFWNCPIMSTVQTEYLPLVHFFSSFFFLPLQPRQPGRTFSRQHVNFKSKELKMIKDSAQSFAGFQNKREKTVQLCR